jgi:hypothetical protein
LNWINCSHLILAFRSNDWNYLQKEINNQTSWKHERTLFICTTRVTGWVRKKTRPKCSQTHDLSERIHNFYRRKSGPRMLLKLFNGRKLCSPIWPPCNGKYQLKNSMYRENLSSSITERKFEWPPWSVCKMLNHQTNQKA